jgi:hypothetical protein
VVSVVRSEISGIWYLVFVIPATVLLPEYYYGTGAHGKRKVVSFRAKFGMFLWYYMNPYFSFHLA